jgi:hypothetical protein
MSESSSSISRLTKAHDICVSKSLLDCTNKKLRRMVQQTRRGMAMRLKPDLVLDGSGGTYFLHDARKVRVGVFKPADEEPYAPNNPRGHVRIEGTNEIAGTGMSMRAGIQPGEACLREVAAYMLDHDHFANVPMTTLAEARHPAFHQNGSMLNLNQGGAAVGTHSLSSLGASPLQTQRPIKKVGSFQEYVSGECCMDDLSPSKIADDEVHKIAILDIRIMNADRNTANLICRRNPEDPDFFQLIPIDHGYCLRSAADVCWFDWCWLDWPHMKRPVSAATKEYIMNLDIEADARMLKERLNIPDRNLEYFRASSKLLKAGIKKGMTLYDIAVLCCRNDDAGELPSRLELLISMADDISKSAVDNGRWHHSAAMRALEEQLSPSPQLVTRQMRKSSLPMFKSLSTMDFSSMTLGSQLNKSESNPPTPLAQSSGSESSTEADGLRSVGDEECEEWAASFVANTLQLSSTPAKSATRRQRSISFARDFDDSELVLSDASGSGEDDSSDSASSTELSSSPKGFWFVPPSASKERIDDSTWSPHSSPGPRTMSPELGLRRDLDMEGLELERSSRVVKFDIPDLIPPVFLRSSNHNVENSPNSFLPVDNKNVTEQNTLAEVPNEDMAPAKPLAMKRSNSYSAFSFKRIFDEDDTTILPRLKADPREDTEQGRHYFQKFVDLLIDREITPKTI